MFSFVTEILIFSSLILAAIGLCDGISIDFPNSDCRGATGHVKIMYEGGDIDDVRVKVADLLNESAETISGHIPTVDGLEFINVSEQANAILPPPPTVIPKLTWVIPALIVGSVLFLYLAFILVSGTKQRISTQHIQDDEMDEGLLESHDKLQSPNTARSTGGVQFPIPMKSNTWEKVDWDKVDVIYNDGVEDDIAVQRAALSREYTIPTVERIESNGDIASQLGDKDNECQFVIY